MRKHLKKGIFVGVLAGCIILIAFVFFFWANNKSKNDNVPEKQITSGENKKNVLVLNSYHKGFTWTDDQTDGILTGLREYANLGEISIEYLDWKRYPIQENLDNVYSSLKTKFQSMQMDIVICTDDAAFSFALKNREELFSNAPIVFSGVNEDGLKQLGTGNQNYTGVLEEIDPAGTIRAAMSINPDIDKLYIICDNTESGLSTGELCEIAAAEVDSNLEVFMLNDIPTEEIFQQISEVDNNSLVLVTTYTFDTNNQYVDHEKFCEKISSISPVPVYHLFDFSLNHGIFGGNLIVGRLQGEMAGKLAVDILNGGEADLIPPVTDRTNQLTFDYNQMLNYQIAERSLPENSVLINEPFSFIKTYWNLVVAVSIIFFLLITFTLILLFYIRKIKKMQKTLKANNEELSQLYEELTATEEEIRNQYQEVTKTHEQLEVYSNKLYQLAHHDQLTGLYNRLYLCEEIEKALIRQTIESALVFIDLDNFKYVNDALGHHIGDNLLQVIGYRLKNISDEHHILIRLGGDEFVFFLDNLDNIDEVEPFVKTIMELFRDTFRIQENIILVTVSIGIALYPHNGHNIDTLLRNADMAMYKVKNTGKNGYFFFNQLIKEEIMERINIENNFKKALLQEEFVLYYQPQVIAITGETDGFEALVRWNSKELGMLPPNRFIGVAEETGFILELGDWILRTACIYIKELNRVHNKQFNIAVNISVIQLFQENFVNSVKDILEEVDFPPSLLELEITESVIMESAELASEKIQELRNLGISIALDDFGTGYSSLAYLKNIPITTLKVDKLFVDEIIDPTSQINLADTIIDLGHKMNLTIVAEGVETKEQSEYLRINGCDKIQGFYYAKPMSQETLEKWIHL